MSDPSYTQRDASLAVECPLCFAEPGDACCSELGDSLEPAHDERIDQLRIYVRAGIAKYDEAGERP